MITVNESAPRGGKTVYGAKLGILMLETEFPRVPGDVGNNALHFALVNFCIRI